MDLSTAQLDRACGVLLAAAAGDALGAGHESPGEWTDDTFTAIVLAETAIAGADLAVSRERTAGNGSLMRAAPVALAFLDDPDGLAEAALSALTHDDPEAGDACVLWCHAVRHAVLTGRLDARAGLDRLAEPGRTRWAERLKKAEQARTQDFTRTGRVVEALQAAWCAITTTEVPEDEPSAGSFRADHLRLALEEATRGGRDVAAIAGGLLGAAYGASAVPARWRLELHGRPGLRSRDLVALAATVATGGTYARPVYGGGHRPAVTEPHPDDPGLLLADLAGLRAMPPGVTAVVSLCTVGEQDEEAVLARTPHWLEVRLADTDDPAENENLDFVLHDTVTAIERLRAAGHVVLVHCVAAYSRTPTIGALYAMRRTGADPGEAIAAMERALPEADPTDAFRDALQRARPDGGWGIGARGLR
ncbi:ADP-ribosylglycohydrolase family protein [Actinomadura rugatobispora]|uniref:ADP-ribosylglycohydrolase family protein n=1 Tax=Actinomadura rugatobispora TaxID=1994 RepID=A0ABW1AIM4_9ACTN